MSEPTNPDRDDDAATEQLPLLITAEEAAEFLGLGRSTFFRLDVKGLVPRALYIGRMRRWTRSELRRWVARGCPPRHVWEEMNS